MLYIITHSSLCEQHLSTKKTAFLVMLLLQQTMLWSCGWAPLVIRRLFWTRMSQESVWASIRLLELITSMVGRCSLQT